MMTAGQIKTRRLEMGLSRAEFAAKVDITQSYLADIERGRHRPSARVQAKIEEELAESGESGSNGDRALPEPPPILPDADPTPPTTHVETWFRDEIPVALARFAMRTDLSIKHFLRLIELARLLELWQANTTAHPLDEAAWAKLHDAVRPFF